MIQYFWQQQYHHSSKKLPSDRYHLAILSIEPSVAYLFQKKIYIFNLAKYSLTVFYKFIYSIHVVQCYQHYVLRPQAQANLGNTQKIAIYDYNKYWVHTRISQRKTV